MQWKRLVGNTGWVLLVFLILTVVLTCVLIFPTQLIDRSLDPNVAKRLTPAERLKAENDIRMALIQGVGGLIVLIGGLAAWRQIQINRDALLNSLESNAEQLRLSQEGQITERFTRAIDQLGGTSIEVQLGGIYALERIAKESEYDRIPIIEILTAYVRMHSPWPPKDGSIETDLLLSVRAPAIQAIMTVLGRREITQDDTINLSGKFTFDGDRIEIYYRTSSPLQLSGVDLRKADLVKANLIGAMLMKSNLEKAEFQSAQMQSADLRGAILKEARFDHADLAGVQLSDAHLEGADLTDALNLDGALLLGARADFHTTWPTDFNWRNAGVTISTSAQ